MAPVAAEKMHAFEAAQREGRAPYKVADLKLAEGVEAVFAENFTIVTVVPPVVEAAPVEEAEVAVAAEGAPAAEGAAEGEAKEGADKGDRGEKKEKKKSED